ncbi:hypothetical protein VPH35_112927 [Triticum aestivum]
MANPSLPCLVFEYGDKRPTTLYGAADGAHRPCEIDVLLTKQNWVSAHGWVLARDLDTTATFLWDPRDPEHFRVALPSLAQAPAMGSDCVLSGDPTGPDGCTVVLTEPDESVLWYCHVGSTVPKWVRHEYDLGGKLVVIKEFRYWQKEHIFCLTPHNGKFYYPIHHSMYGVLEFSPEPMLSTVKTKGIKLTFPPLHMVCLFFADFDMRTVIDVAVYKMGFARSRCVRVNNIGARAIHASVRSTSASWCPANKFRLRPNTLYWMSEFDKCLHMYDIGSNKEVEHEREGTAMELLRPPFWLVPVHRP